jgi:hypothetical protein
MGKVDEHWCNICKKPLDKTKDKYVEFELVNVKRRRIGAKLVRPKGLICEECLNKDPKLREALETFIKAGNPTFSPVVECLSWRKCSNYEPIADSPIRCKHIAVIKDMLYCKRSHPGGLELTIEQAEWERLERQIVFDMLQKTMKDKNIAKIINKAFFEKELDKIYIPPSVAIINEHEKQQTQWQGEGEPEPEQQQ